MTRKDALYAAMCLGTIAFAIAFVYPQLAAQAIAWYHPIGGGWTFEARPAGLAIDFYGRLGQGVVAWAVAVLVALPLARRAKPLSDRAAGLLLAWALTLTLLVMLYYAWTLYFRVPVPEPLPEAYRPR